MPTATPTPTPVEVTSPPAHQEWGVTLPVRDLVDLALRFGVIDSPEAALPKADPDLNVGDVASFWVSYRQGGVYELVPAKLTAVSEHAVFYVENGISVSDKAMQQTVAGFERTSYPTVDEYFGPVWSRAADANQRVYVLITRLSGVDGYFNGLDSYSRAINPFSNQRPIIYVSSTVAEPGTSRFTALMTHELQHLARWNQQPGADTWVNEGSSELAVRLAGFPINGGDRAFAFAPDTQLTAWGSDPGQSGAHYGAAYLFLSYFEDRFGEQALRDLLHGEGRGADLFTRFFTDTGRAGSTFDDLFANWVVANYLDDPSLLDGRFGYQQIQTSIRSIANLGPVESAGDRINQYGARYYSLPLSTKDMELVFNGSPTASLLPTTPHSGQYMWWSNRADNLDSTLTTTADLTSVSRATLRFWTWYDIEPSYDYAYVAVSLDHGATWTSLPGKYTTVANPRGNNLGHAYTGRSGDGAQPAWVQEEMDLSAYAGKVVQIRFEYVTDDSYSAPGFAVDDVEIPEIGWRNDANVTGELLANGFARTDNSVPQNFALWLVRQGEKTEVQRVLMDDQQRAVLDIPASQGDQHLTLIVAAMAPLTTEPANVDYSLRELPTRANSGQPTVTPSATVFSGKD
ncbi:MAG: hypothetical protein ACYC1C_13350 [Chloroflexota bacterium]